MTFVKIIYFDESFVTDFMQIIAGGEIKKTTEFLSNVSVDAGANGSAALSTHNDKVGMTKFVEFFTGINAKVAAEAKGDFSYSKNTVVKNILENTLLADFLDLIKRDTRKKEENRKCKKIEMFPTLKVTPEPNSLTFYMLASPYMSMLDGDIPLLADDGSEFKLDIKQIRNAIESGRGYYEFISKHDSKEIILRFNITAFRNNYTMSDLTKMELTYYAIYVGKSKKSKLQIQTEFEFGIQNLSREQYGYPSENVDSTEELNVYDVVLAGVQG